MQFTHAPGAVSAVFDDPNLVSAAGLVPALRLAQRAGVAELVQDRLSVPTDKCSNAGAKVAALVAGMLAGADSIDDMNLLRHGGMGKLFDRTYAPSTLVDDEEEFASSFDTRDEEEDLDMPTRMEAAEEEDERDASA